VGQLRQAFVHRSGLELSRLTSGNRDELLFDDVLTIAVDGGRWRLWGRMGRSEQIMSADQGHGVPGARGSADEQGHRVPRGGTARSAVRLW